MALYTELKSLFEDGTLLGRVEVALVIAADAIRVDAAATVIQKTWANKIISTTGDEAKKALKLALVQNKNLTLTQLKDPAAVTDIALQTAINSLVGLLSGNGS